MLIRHIVIPMVLFVFITISCTENHIQPIEGPPDPAYIEISVDSPIIKGFIGDHRSAEFCVVCLDARGVGMPGVEIELSILDPEEWKGNISPAKGDSMRTIYSVLLMRSGIVVIGVGVGGRILKTIGISLDVASSIELCVSNSQIVGSFGEECSAEITATARNEEGEPVSGLEISFSIPDSQTWMGHIEPLPGDSVTDENGELRARYVVTLERSGEVVIEAGGGQVTATELINLILNPPVASLELRITHDIITGFIGEERSETVTATARDSNGVPVPGAVIVFGIQDPASWKGTISPEGEITDENGELEALYTVVIERSGEVVIEARSGSVIATLEVFLRVVIDLDNRR